MPQLETSPPHMPMLGETASPQREHFGVTTNPTTTPSDRVLLEFAEDLGIAHTYLLRRR